MLKCIYIRILHGIFLINNLLLPFTREIDYVIVFNTLYFP